MSENSFDMSGKTAIVIGATQGMGAQIAEDIAASGGQVIITSRSQTASDAKADELNAKYAKDKSIAVGKAGDLSIKPDLQAIVDTAIRTFGQITTLVISPTIRPFFGPSIETTDEEIDEQFLYIFKSRFWISAMCIPHMQNTGGGSVIYIGSGSAFESTTERSVYSCARAAEVQMMKNFAAEFGRDNIRFNIISPALIKSSGAEALFRDPAVLERFESRLPMKRHGLVAEISQSAMFLASDLSSFTTGCVVPVDGGRNLHCSSNDLTSSFTPDKDSRHRNPAEAKA